LRRKKEKKDEAEEEEERKEETKRHILGKEIPIHAMRFDLKNVKLKVPKIPHTIFGRLMAKDDYFPTAIGTFRFEIERSMLQDRRQHANIKKKKQRDEGGRTEPQILPIPLMSSGKMQTKELRQESFVKLGQLTIRVIGYITDGKGPETENAQPKEAESAKTKEEIRREQDRDIKAHGAGKTEDHEIIVAGQRPAYLT